MVVDPGSIALEDISSSKGRYVYRSDGEEAYMTFSRAGQSRLIIDHTEVPEAFKGQGIGAALVERAVADAREQGKTILPLCPFAASQFRKHPDWADALDRRAAR